jgi:hypothetical protein
MQRSEAGALSIWNLEEQILAAAECASFLSFIFLLPCYQSFRLQCFGLLSCSPYDIPIIFTPLQDASALLGGNGVFGRMKFESGVHRVQRTPLTEKVLLVLTTDLYALSVLLSLVLL